MQSILLNWLNTFSIHLLPVPSVDSVNSVGADVCISETGVMIVVVVTGRVTSASRVVVASAACD